MPTITEAEMSEMTALLGDIHKQYGRLDGEFKTRVKRLEDEIAVIRQRRTNAAGLPESTFRELIQLSKEFQNRPPVRPGMTVTAPFDVKDIIGVSRSMPEVVSTIAGGPRQQTRVASLIPQTATSAGAVTYTREASFTNNAAAVAEGAAKPKSDKTFVTATAPIEVIAHHFTISKQSYEDLPSLAAQVESNGLYGIDLKVDQQVLKGTGVAPEIGPGLYVAAPAAASVAVGTTMMDRIFLAAAEVNAAGWETDGVVLNATDYTAMVLAKDTQGRYLGLTSLPLPRLVVSSVLAPGEFLVGAFSQAHLFVREQATVTVAAQHADNFTHNLLTVLVETRLALVVYQASAFRKAGPVATAEAASSERRKA